MPAIDRMLKQLTKLEFDSVSIKKKIEGCTNIITCSIIIAILLQSARCDYASRN